MSFQKFLNYHGFMAENAVEIRTMANDFNEASYTVQSEPKFVQAIADKYANLKRDADKRDGPGIRNVATGLFADLVRYVLTNPEGFLQLLDRFFPVVEASSEIVMFGIPDDHEIGASVASNEVAYHVPTGEDRERYDELTGAGEGEIVAVLDTGVDSNHPDIKDNLLGVFSEVPGESGEDINGHGTHVFGTCAGVNPDICLSYKAKGISIKVLGGRQGSGQSNWIESGLRRAREWRGPNGERVTHINMSLGGGGFHAGTEAELKLCAEAGIVIHAASGNDGWRRGAQLVNWPAKSDHAIAEGAIDQNEDRAPFTSPGGELDEASPGVGVVSAAMGGGRVAMSGTSMASPVGCSKSQSNQSFHVRHGLGRINGTAGHRAFLQANGRDIFDPGFDETTGNGVFDVYETLLPERPDDISGLASNDSDKSGGSVVGAVILFVCMFFFGGQAMAQELNVETVVETVEITETFYGGQLVSSNRDEPRVISQVKTQSPAKAIKVDASQATVIGTDLTAVVYEVKDGLLLLTEPGRYLVLPGAVDAAAVVIEAPEPEFDLSGVASFAARLADNVGDSETRFALADNYSTQVDLIGGMSVGTAQAKVKQSTLDNVFSKRGRNSQGFDWVNGFQRPLEAEFDRLGLAEWDIETYREALRQTAQGLKTITPVAVVEYSAEPAMAEVPLVPVQIRVCNPDGSCTIQTEYRRAK